MQPRRKPTDTRLAGALAVLLAVSGSLAMQAVAAGTDPHTAVLGIVRTLFDGMRNRDATALRAVFAAEARLGDEGIDGFVNAVSTGERHLDEVTFDETVLIDGDLAMAWTPYNLFIDGEFHHCGVDLFVMRRRDGRWLITQLDDTRRTDGCDPERRN
ncbi:MAG: nuclear transport factor 2 family protein [Halieaceae bacterium]|jgi:hypothetical protein|nr:nuclear transport factor 2 family protein [Halieaceae bacterium]